MAHPQVAGSTSKQVEVTIERAGAIQPDEGEAAEKIEIEIEIEGGTEEVEEGTEAVHRAAFHCPLSRWVWETRRLRPVVAAAGTIPAVRVWVGARQMPNHT